MTQVLHASPAVQNSYPAATVPPTGHTMVNATQMAKPFGKKPGHWLRLLGTKRFISSLGEVQNIPPAMLVKKIKNGPEHGTWLHQDVALEFARWLSPAFALWSNGQVKNQLAAGGTAIHLMEQVEQLQQAVLEQARIMEYHDAVLQSKTLITTTVIAKELGMSAVALNKLLHDNNVVYKSNDHWVLYAEHCGKGYTGTKTAIFQDSAGNYQSNIHTYWTEKGRAFIHALVKEINKEQAQQVA